MPFVLERAICLNGKAVPVIARTMDLEDPKNLIGGDVVQIEVVCVDLKATSNAYWIEQAFGLGARFWRGSSCRIPLLCEMRTCIEEGKTKKGAAARMPKCPQIIVPIQVREKVVLVQNNTSSLMIALQKGQELETLQWFLEELEKDLSTMAKASKKKRSECEQDEKDEKGEDDKDEEGEAIKNTQDKALEDPEAESLQSSLTRLRGHTQCSRAAFLRSRNALRVVRADKETSEFGIQSLVKKRKTAMNRQDMLCWAEVNHAYQKATEAAIGFLNGVDSSPPITDQ